MLISFLRRHAPAIALLANVAASQSAFAQAVIPPRTFRVTVSQRWLDSGQQSRVVPLDRRTYWLFVETSRRRIDGVTHHVSLDVPVNARLQATIDARTDGRSQRIDMTSRFSYPILEDSVLRVRDSLLSERPFSLPESRVWEVIPSFHPARLQRGERWTDTLAFTTEECGSSQSLYAVRVSTLLADTTVGGRRLWLVSDSADVYYEEIIALAARSPDTIDITVRSAKGVLKGRMLYDPELGLLREREDTAALSGSARFSNPAGRSYEVPVRLEQRRRWDMYDSSTNELWSSAQFSGVKRQ